MSRPPMLPASSKAGGLKALRTELTKLGFTEEGLRERLGLGGMTSAEYFAALADPPLVPSQDGLSPLDWLIHLFLLGDPVARTELARLLSDEALEALEATQLVQRSGAEVEATAALLPYESLYLLADFVGSGRSADAVGFPDPATVAGARLMEPSFDDDRGLAVCLSAGTGLLPLLLRSRYGYDKVRVHDESPRARQLTELAAALNDLQVEISAEPLSGPAEADLVTGSVVGVFRNSNVWSGRRASPADEGRWDRAFGAVEGLLGEKGRAVLCHEVRRMPDNWFVTKLQPILGTGKLEMVFIHVRGTGMYDSELAVMGVSLLRRRDKESRRAPLSLAGNLLGLPNSTARGLQLHLESQRAISLPPLEVLKLIPYRNARATVSIGYEVGPDRTLVPGRVQIGPYTWPPQALEVLNLCNNANTLQQVADHGENYAQLALELVMDGSVYLRKP
jgi:hypothetical protein